MAEMTDTAINQIRGKLVEYLASHGRIVSGRSTFKCITGTHEDRNPSCGVLPANKQVWKCFQCGKSGSIFHAAFYLEGLPLTGSGFIDKTVPTLAERFGIHFDRSEIIRNQEDVEISAVLEDAANVLMEHGTFEHAKSRGWNEETCRQLGIATIDFESMRTCLLDLGHGADSIRKADINSLLFKEDGLTFTIRDIYGKTIGFSTRNMFPSEGEPKYVNTSSKVKIFTKRGNLYGLHLIYGKKKEVYLVEGQACVVTMWQFGYKNAVACGSACISQEQVDLLVRAGVTTCILALDADQAGEAGISRALDNVFGYREDIRAKVLDMSQVAKSDYVVKFGPERKPGHCDVDELLRIDAELLRKIQPKDSFEWRLSKVGTDEDPIKICQDMIPVILSEPSNIRRDAMSSILAERTGIRKEAIDRDIDIAVRKEDIEVKSQIESLGVRLARRLQKASPGSIIDILEEGSTEARSIVSSNREDKFSSNETVLFVEEVMKSFEEVKQGLRGLDCGFETINKATRGIPPSGKLIGVPAQPNVGKTALVTAIGWNTLNLNSDSDHIVLHYTIDDSRETLMSRIIAMDSNVDIDLVTQPSMASSSEKEKIGQSWEKLMDLIRSGRYDIRDASQGTSLNYLEEWLKHTHEGNKDKDIIVIFDNFHKLEGDSSDLRVKFLSASQRLQRMKNNPRLGRPTIIATMEMVKTRDRQAGVFDIAETNQILYDSDMIIVLHSEFIGAGEEATNFWINPEDRSVQPMVKGIVEKNKISSFKGVFWLEFLSTRSRMKEVRNYISPIDREYV